MTGITFIDITLYGIIIFAIVLIANIIGTLYFAFFHGLYQDTEQKRMADELNELTAKFRALREIHTAQAQCEHEHAELLRQRRKYRSPNQRYESSDPRRLP